MTAPTDEEAIARFIKMLCKQRLSTEHDDDAEGGDYEGAYDAFINEARALLPRLSAGSGWRPLQEAHVACPNCGQSIHFKFDMNEIRPGDAREQCATPHTLVVLPEMDGTNAQDSAVPLPSPEG